MKLLNFARNVNNLVQNSKKLLKEPRRNRFPYPLYVGNIPGEEERPGEL